MPLAVDQLPEAYRKNDKKNYQPDKAWWITGQVTALTRGYYSVLQPEVLERAHGLEAEARSLVESSAGLSPEDFRKALAENAGSTMVKWRQLHGELLAKHEIDRRMDYGKAQQLKSDKVQKY